MKRNERHHLKENDLAGRLTAARDFVETRRSMWLPVGIGVVVIAVLAGGFAIYRNRSSAGGEQLLAEAMVAFNAPVVPTGTPGAEGVPAAAQLGATGTFSTEQAKLTAALPKLQAAADAHPGTAAGITARYHLAGALATMNRTNEAMAAFDQVVEQAGADSLYGRMARLGKAEAQADAGQLDAAIATWKELTTQAADELPVDAILMELARAYLQKGDTAEARKAFTQIVDQHADSPYLADARRELDGLKG
jgi:tetratricopeptide (TPR) repeat protein